MCGKPAVARCGAKLVMFASSSSCLDSLGYPVRRRCGRDEVRIEMPRCASCRSWTTGWIAAAFVVTAAASIAGTLVQSVFFFDVSPPPWIKVFHEGIGNMGTGIGLVLGFVAALLAMARERKRSGRQSANTYPPIVSLRKLGWSFISD
jgi:hypothetical protein